jgi:ParB family chromosome partitioning protein
MDPDVYRLQKQLSDQLGAKVAIMNKSYGKGKLIIEYNSLEELEGILEHILITEDL